ncbi:MAG: hypothetical protein ACI9ND_001599 [Yoonia sp.]
MGSYDVRTWGLVGHRFNQKGDRITDAVAGHSNYAYFQCLFVDPNVDLAPDAVLRAAMLARILLTFAFSLDTGAVHKAVPSSP